MSTGLGTCPKDAEQKAIMFPRLPLVFGQCWHNAGDTGFFTWSKFNGTEQLLSSSLLPDPWHYPHPGGQSHKHPSLWIPGLAGRGAVMILETSEHFASLPVEGQGQSFVLVIPAAGLLNFKEIPGN